MTNEKRGEMFVREFSITDDLNVKHKCVLAGVLEVESYDEEVSTEKYSTKGSKDIQTITSWIERRVYKTLNFGLSITNPTDQFDFDLGLLIAVGRANKPTKVLGTLTSSDRSMLGVEMVEVIMDQQMNYIIQNKGRFLKSNGPILVPEEKVSDDVPF